MSGSGSFTEFQQHTCNRDLSNVSCIKGHAIPRPPHAPINGPATSPVLLCTYKYGPAPLVLPLQERITLLFFKGDVGRERTKNGDVGCKYSRWLGACRWLCNRWLGAVAFCNGGGKVIPLTLPLRKCIRQTPVMEEG